ncbi:MAG: hypothetical protein AAFU49_23065, partial [Pseudomonadota bacterium]
AALPAGRTLVSFRLGTEPTGKVVLLKMRTEDGRSEALLLATPVALHIRDRIAETLRAKPGLSEVPKDDAFFAAQPEIVPEDWSPDSAHVGTPRGAHVETAGQSCVIAFPMDDAGDDAGSYTACRMTPLQAAYFLHAINAAEENGDLGGDGKADKTVH